jgi:hypothetical protein
MGEPRKREEKHDHHFTPVLYLKNFTDAKGFLRVVRRSDGRRFSTGPKGIGLQRDLYWPDELADGEDPNVYEDQFSEFEGKAAPVMQDIITNRRMPMDEEQLRLLFNFIAFQAVRTPSMRRVIAAPREYEARIIMNLLQSSKELYESHMRKAGYDLEKHPHEKFAQGRYKARLTTEGFIEGAMTMMNTMLQYLHRRSWSVLASDQPSETFVVSDHPVVLEWSDPRGRRLPPGHAHLDSELTFPLSSHVALFGCYEPFEIEVDMMPGYVSGVNSRTINACRVFIAASEDKFILQDAGRIISSDEFVDQLKADHANRGS